MSASRVWLITGVSTGLGRALAVGALAEGDRVVGTIRHAEQRASFEALGPGRATARLLDVTESDAVRRVVSEVARTEQRIDVLVNNAGYGALGAVEEFTEAEIRAQFETNVFGALAVTRAVLPVLRAQGAGHIVQISSVSGLVARAGSGIYSASKFALEGFSEALAAELAPLGIHVTLVEPGAFRTDWAGRSLTWSAPLPAYDGTVGQMRGRMADWSGRQPGDPAKAAAAIVRLVNLPDPPVRLLLGNDAVDIARAKLDTLRASIAALEAVSRATAFD